MDHSACINFHTSVMQQGHTSFILRNFNLTLREGFPVALRNLHKFVHISANIIHAAAQPSLVDFNCISILQPNMVGFQ